MKATTHTLREETEFFKGKIVESVRELSYEPFKDDKLICIVFTDGSRIVIDAVFGSYDENNRSNNEYPIEMYCRFKKLELKE